jgi:hypothetical protein
LRRGRTEEAITWLRSHAEADDTSEATRMLAEENRHAAWTGALEAWAEGLRERGLTEEAARLRRYGIEPGGRIADPWEASVQA